MGEGSCGSDVVAPGEVEVLTLWIGSWHPHGAHSSCVRIKYFCEIFMELVVVGASVNHHDQNRDIDTSVR